MTGKKQSQGKVPGHDSAPAAPRTSRFSVTSVEVEGREETKVVEIPSLEPEPWTTDKPLQIVGASVARMDAVEKVTGRARYTTDERPRAMLHAVIVRSPIARGRVTRLDLTQALGRPARVTVCGLNPHAGEHGLFSHGEEERLILPAVRRAQAEGMQVVGPLPPDTAFVPHQRQLTDVYVCMYHDQGLIPLKALAFDDAVNVTLGLPIVRTSVDHGTAMDIAWQGVASDRSLHAAIEMAIHLA